jgi:hypothetical protein
MMQFQIRFPFVLTTALLVVTTSQTVRAQAPGLMGSDVPSDVRMPLMMLDDFCDMHLVAWRVEISLSDIMQPRFNRQLEQIPAKTESLLGDRKLGRHIFSTAGFLDDEWTRTRDWVTAAPSRRSGPCGSGPFNPVVLAPCFCCTKDYRLSQLNDD